MKKEHKAIWARFEAQIDEAERDLKIAQDNLDRKQENMNALDNLLLKLDGREKGCFLPEKAGYELIAIHFENGTFLYHDIKSEPPLSIELNLTKHGDLFRLTTFVPSSKSHEFNGVPNSGRELYKGAIANAKEYEEILKVALRPKLREGDMVVCATDEERQKVIEVYKTLRIPKEYLLDFKYGYPMPSCPNLMWRAGKSNKNEHWQEPDNNRRTSHLVPWGKPAESKTWDLVNVLPIDEFIARMQKHEGGDYL